MPKLPRLTHKQAIKLIEENGFIFSRQVGSHAQYYKESIRITIPIHNNKELNYKIVKQVLTAIESFDN